MTKEALKLALEALGIVKIHYTQNCHVNEAITAIKEALAQEQEHFALKHSIAELEGAVIGLQAQLAQPEQERPAPCAKHCEATAFQITIKNLKAELAQTQEQEPVAYTGNGTAGREMDVRPTGFFFQMPPQTDEFKCPLCYDDIANIKNPSQPEPVTWGVDWGRAGDIPCVSIIKRLPDGGIQVLAVEYAPYSYTTPLKQEPVAYTGNGSAGREANVKPNGFFFQRPSQRTWQGLTDEEIAQGCKESWITEEAWKSAVWWAEAKLREKNT